ncbi:hypothetical protein DFS34DRAFT_249496 [Phlyctochytrium arcticum]|nr:hypothetical protein DFS34DRAFT_249496 [Phlyctochytrium arcticum]
MLAPVGISHSIDAAARATDGIFRPKVTTAAKQQTNFLTKKLQRKVRGSGDGNTGKTCYIVQSYRGRGGTIVFFFLYWLERGFLVGLRTFKTLLTSTQEPRQACPTAKPTDCRCPTELLLLLPYPFLPVPDAVAVVVRYTCGRWNEPSVRVLLCSRTFETLLRLTRRAGYPTETTPPAPENILQGLRRLSFHSWPFTTIRNGIPYLSCLSSFTDLSRVEKLPLARAEPNILNFLPADLSTKVFFSLTPGQ